LRRLAAEDFAPPAEIAEHVEAARFLPISEPGWAPHPGARGQANVGSSLCIVVPFILEMLAFHHLTTGDRRYWTHAAVIFTVVYAVFVTANYVVQLATVIPARLHGEGDALRLLEQTPHSLFWDFDAIGYVAMGLAALVAIPALESTGFEKWVRRSFIAHAAVTPLIAFVYFYPTFTPGLLVIGFPWAITAPLFMGMLALLLRTRPDVESRP
jgi:heme/copper-type cytochrome/quinol oxidase subunit 4